MRMAMSLEEFLAWEERQELPWEFDGLVATAMTGGTMEHALIQANLIGALRERLRGGPCRAVGSHVKIAAARSIRYPDAVVVCTPVPRGATVVAEPVVVFEVLSPSTVSIDLTVKNQEYRDTPTIRRYVILQQDRPGAVMFARDADDWVGHIVPAGGGVPLPEIGIELPLAELYEGVSFATSEDAA